MEKNKISELDAKDRKIMKVLFDDGRASFSKIAKQVGLSKESVNYRIKGYEKTGLIRGYTPILNVKKMGWKMYLIYIKYGNIDREAEKELLLKLHDHPNIAWLIKCIGTYDIVLKIFAKNFIHASNIVKTLESENKQTISECTTDSLFEEQAVPFSFLFGKEITGTLHKIIFDDIEKRMDELDYKILKELSTNARMPLSEISSKVGKSRELVAYHLKKLEREQVIIKYRPATWLGAQTLGFNWYLVMLKLNQLDDRTSSQLESFLLNEPNVTYFYKTVGSSDMQIEIRIKSTIELNKLLIKLRSILKGFLKSYEILIILEEIKYTYFPECLSKIS